MCLSVVLGCGELVVVCSSVGSMWFRCVCVLLDSECMFRDWVKLCSDWLVFLVLWKLVLVSILVLLVLGRLC